MAKITYCDICYCPIKIGDKKHILGSLSVIEVSEADLQFVKQSLYYQQERENVQLHEICEGCKEVLEHLFYIRKDELEKIKQQIESFKVRRRRK